MTDSARDVIAKAPLYGKLILRGEEWFLGDHAAGCLLTALREAGFTVVPVAPTEAMVETMRRTFWDNYTGPVDWLEAIKKMLLKAAREEWMSDLVEKVRAEMLRAWKDGHPQENYGYRHAKYAIRAVLAHFAEAGNVTDGMEDATDQAFEDERTGKAQISAAFKAALKEMGDE